MIGLSSLRASAWKYGCIAALAGFVCAAVFGTVQSVRLAHEQTAKAQVAKQWAEAKAAQSDAEAKASEAARNQEQTRVRYVNGVAASYEKGKADAQATADHVADDLRAGNIRLRGEIRALATDRVSGNAPAAGQPSDAAERGAELAGAAIGVGADCDARVAALIAAYDAASK